MGGEKISVETRCRVLCIGLEDPANGNALDTGMFLGIAAALGRLEADDDLRCCVLFASGPEFTRGLDVDSWVESIALPAGSSDPLQLDEAARVSKPILMAVQGCCLSVGFELMLAADIRVATSDALFAFLSGQASYPGGPSLRLVMEVGWEIARPYLAGKTMTADEAYSFGIINEVVGSGEQLARVLFLAGRIAESDPALVASQVRAFRKGRNDGLKRRLVSSFLRAGETP